MTRSKKPSKPSKGKPAKAKRPKTVTVQAVIPEHEYELLAGMSNLFENSLSGRLAMIIHHELEEGYPKAFVEFDGESHLTWMLIEKYEAPVMNDCYVLIAPEHAKGIFPEALDRHKRAGVRVTMPLRSPGIFAITSNCYQDARGVWHIQLLRVGQVDGA